MKLTCFKSKLAVLQGDTLAPFLFVLAVDYAMRQAIDGHEEQLGLKRTTRPQDNTMEELMTPHNKSHRHALC